MKRFLAGIANGLRRLTRRGPVPTPATTRPTQPARPAPTRPAAPAAPSKAGPSTTAPSAPPARPATTSTQAPRGRHLAYNPQLNGKADPGEIVWTWVPYEEDASQGKDRPVLVVGRDGRRLLGLMLSSQSDRDGQRHWLALGSGDWDREARPSWIRLDRVITVHEQGVRREGAILDRSRFDRVAKALRGRYGWQ